jgi:hypothetical protein
MKYVWPVCLLLWALVSCEKTVHLDLKEQPPKLVVDAKIENGEAPVVVLSRSLNYFSVITRQEEEAAFVHDARVIVNDGSKDHVLREFKVAQPAGYFTYYYSIPRSDAANFFTGALNHSYKLQVQVKDSAVYSATTTIPLMAKTCDSLWWKPAPLNADSFAVVYGRFTDPPAYGNYTRYFTRVNREPYYPGLISVFDDQLVNGTTYDLQIDKGYDKNRSLNFNNGDFGLFTRGDTVTLKFCNIDKASYDFWRTWDFNYQTNGNPFSTPGKILSNISNNGLGAFCGYAVQYKTLIIPK